jgi:hypothetical protein
VHIKGIYPPLADEFFNQQIFVKNLCSSPDGHTIIIVPAQIGTAKKAVS